MRSRKTLILILIAGSSLVASHRPSSADWLPNIVTLCNAPGNRYFVALASDGGGGVIATWEDARNGASDIYAGRVNAGGVSQWDTTGVAVCTAGGAHFPAIVPDGAGGVIIAWQDGRPGGIFAQRIDADGLPRWDPNGVALSTGTAFGPTLISDGAGGAFVAWTDGSEDIYAQRVSAAGAPQWAPNGVPVCTASVHKDGPAMASAGVAGVIVTWNDARGSAFVQLVNPDGVTQWTPNGVALGPAVNGFSGRSCTIVPDGFGGAIVGWKYSDQIYAGRVSATGVPRWGQNGVALVPTTNFKYRLVSVSDGGGGAIIAWTDDGGGVEDLNIHGARVDSLGVSQWNPTSGLAICAAGGDQDFTSIAPDGVGGAILAWDDQGRFAAYAQRVSAAGVPLWATDGTQLSAYRAGSDPKVVSGGTGVAIVVWGASSSPTSTGIYATRAAGTTTAVTLTTLSADADAAHVRIRWRTYGDAIASTGLYRRTPDSDWMLIGHPQPDLNGYMVFEDTAVLPGIRYGYRLVVRDVVGQENSIETWVSVPQGQSVPAVLRLASAHPNPFGEHGQMSYGLPRMARVRLSVYDVEGRRVATLVDRVEEAGWRSATWDGHDSAGRLAASGTYFVRLEAAGTVRLQKVVVAR